MLCFGFDCVLEAWRHPGGLPEASQRLPRAGRIAYDQVSPASDYQIPRGIKWTADFWASSSARVGVKPCGNTNRNHQTCHQPGSSCCSLFVDICTETIPWALGASAIPYTSQPVKTGKKYTKQWELILIFMFFEVSKSLDLDFMCIRKIFYGSYDHKIFYFIRSIFEKKK